MQSALNAMVGTFVGVLLGLWVLKKALLIILSGTLIFLLHSLF